MSAQPCGCDPDCKNQDGTIGHVCERHRVTYLECPCCGDDGAQSDGEGLFYDGRSLICGCPGWVSVDADGADEPWINNGDAPCQRCHDGS